MPRTGNGMSPEDWLPDPSSILVRRPLTPRGAAAGTGAHAAASQYRILRTLEVDEYDEPIPAADILDLTVPRAPPTENKFRGTSRRIAKLSLADADVETFSDIKDLIDTLPDHKPMSNHPDISNDRDSNRVDEEKRNVRVRAFLYAASIEDDRDFHLIVGRDPSLPPVYMTAEISGLPPKRSDFFQKLDKTRDAYFTFFGDGLPGTAYDFYDPPIPVEIEGSLFFDFSHAEGSRPGPSKLRPKMPVVWEIHPVSQIVFEP